MKYILVLLLFLASCEKDDECVIYLQIDKFEYTRGVCTFMNGKQYFLDRDKRVNEVPVLDYKFKLELYNNNYKLHAGYYDVKCGTRIKI